MRGAPDAHAIVTTGALLSLLRGRLALAGHGRTSYLKGSASLWPSMGCWYRGEDAVKAVCRHSSHGWEELGHFMAHTTDPLCVDRGLAREGRERQGPPVKWASAWLVVFLLACLPGLSLAAAPPASAASAPSALVASETTTFPIVVWNRTVTTLSAPFHGLSPHDRAAAASKRIEDALDTLTVDDISETWAESGADKGVIVRAGNLVLFALLSGDVPGGDRAAVEKEGHRAAEVLRDIVKERSEARRPMELFTDIAVAALATLVLVVLCWLLVRLNRVVQRRLMAIARRRLRLNIAGFDFRPLVWATLRRTVALVHLLLVLFLGYLWLSYVLRQFPYSRPWGAQLGLYMIDLGLQMLSALVGQIPNLVTLVVIFLITRGIVRLISAWFRAVENGTVQVGWLDPPTASITRKLVSVLIGLFALVVAYPYIPGAGSDAFKGVSVFVGLMLSLGSAGIVNQLMSGLVVLYSRAVRVGDFVHVGDHEGTVREMGALSIKLVTRTHEEVIIPNAVLSSTPMRNLTRQLQEGGLLLTTSVTIGYDTPWRQVECLLELAASRTAGLLREPRPFVLQTALSDYYVEYLLNVGTLHPSIYKQTLSDLHQNIQDAFNEFGVQIMSPHFRRQPDDKVWVPTEHWYDPPAREPATSDPAEASDRSKGSAAPAADSGPPT